MKSKLLKNKWFLSLTVIVIAILIFGSGYFAGLTSFSRYFPHVSDLSVSTTKLIPVHMHIVQLDRGDNKALRESLNLELDGAILTTHELLSESKNNKHKTKAKEWLQAIAKHREKHPPTYPTDINGPEHDQVRSYVKTILAGYLEGSKD